MSLKYMKNCKICKKNCFAYIVVYNTHFVVFVFCLSSSCVFVLFVLCLCFVCLRLVSCLSSSCVFVLFFFVFCFCFVCLRLVSLFCLSSSCVYCTQCFKFHWIVHFWLLLWYSLTFIYKTMTGSISDEIG
jgi:hypothetical protein